MITVYSFTDSALKRREFPADGGLPPGTVWIDLMEPSAAEERSVEQALRIDAPTREEMQEIELSSRIYREGDTSYMTATVIYKADTPVPETTVITFIRTPQTLVTLRYAEPQAIRSFLTRAPRQPDLCNSGDAVLLGLIDAIIDRCADIFEGLGRDLDLLSKGIFAAHKRGGDAPDVTDLEDVVRRLGRSEDLTSRGRDSLLSFGRILIFLGQSMTEQKANKDHRQRLKTLMRDVQSLSEHATFLAHKSNFLLDATLGLINIRQTTIIKIFSVAAVVFLPPTLIASIYGMNFQVLPELAWDYGYPFALLLMVISAILPYWFFKRRGWL